MRWCADCEFLRPVFSASRVQHVSDLHPKFGLCGSMVDIQYATAEIRRGKKKKIEETSGYAMVVHGRPKTPKNTSFGGSPSPQGSYSPYILWDTTRPGHVTCVLAWSKSDRRRLRKTLHKQTNKQTNRQTDTTKIMVTWPWTNRNQQDNKYNVRIYYAGRP